MLVLPELRQPCLLRDGVQLLENQQQVRGRLPATGHSLGLGLKEDSSEPQTHRDSSTPRLKPERNLGLCLKVTCFMAFEMCAKALMCHMWPPAQLCKRPGILLCRSSCLQMEGDVETNEK